MKKIKDFLYNWNDIVVILFILVAAAAVIYWRVNYIMDYPKVLAQEMQEQALLNEEESTPQESLIPSGEDTREEEEAGPGSGPEDSDIWAKGRLLKEVTVETGSGDAVNAVAPLVEAGLFTSYEDYVAICEKAEVNPLDIKSDTFTFTAGTTQRDIVKEVTKEYPPEVTEAAEGEAAEGESAEGESAESSEAGGEEASEEEYVEEYDETAEEAVDEG